MTTATKFPCDGCGACCRSVGHLTMIPSTNGVCDHLFSNQCSIYDTRPEICRVDHMREILAPEIDWNQWIEQNTIACIQLKLNDKEMHG
jgi:Fe-S-cluster containining protein